MALEYRYIRDEQPDGNHVVATERLCLTEDQTRLVPETDPAARWLYCTPGQQLPRADAERYGLLAQPEPTPEPTTEPEPEPAAPEPAEPKARAKPADKARTRPADK
ncbi:MAG: hypothetical protein L0Y54_10095 [Sporichthyaceae bacterium]|nr:hypothetical protein [Sporichthyaceae bacterium]